MCSVENFSLVAECLNVYQALLSEDAADAVKALLPEHANGELASVCSWADEIRHYHNWRWSSPLHYIDTPDFKCNYEYCSTHRLFSWNIYLVTLFLIYLAWFLLFGFMTRHLQIQSFVIHFICKCLDG